MNYHSIIGSIIVKPVSEPIYSEQATEVRLEDEAAGLFLVIKQQGKINPPADNTVCITPQEWPQINRAIEDMLVVINREETPCLKPQSNL